MRRPATLRLSPTPAADPDHARAMELAAGGTLDVADAIAFCGLSQSELYRRMDDGRLAFTKCGKRRLIFRLSLVEMLAANARVGP